MMVEVVAYLAGRVQVKDEAVAIASKCNADIRVSSLATDSAAVQRDILLRIGQIVVSTPGQVAQVRTHLGAAIHSSTEQS